MKKSILVLAIAVLFLSTPIFSESEIIKLEAQISWYGKDFDGRPTSSGEIFDMNALTAAHKTLPFGTMLEVTNLENGKKVIVRVNDRGPFVADRELDVSRKAAETLGIIDEGIARASIRKIDGLNAPAKTAVTTSIPAKSATDTSADTSAEKIVEKIPKTKAVADSVAMTVTQGVSWRIQLGSFAREENATRLVVKLRKEGFDPAFEKNGDMTRVVLAGIPDSYLEKTKEHLKKAGYFEWLVKQETW